MNPEVSPTAVAMADEMSRIDVDDLEANRELLPGPAARRLGHAG
jgi:hypothetical protein